MGIHGLMKLLSEECPDAVKEIADMDSLTGRKVAIDASMALYQFLVAVRTNGPGGGMAATMLTNEAGEVTSHIQGMFNRTIKMMTSGVRPLYVFDGKPPQMKGGELAKRIAKRAKAEVDLAEAKEGGDIDEVDKFSRRLVKVTRQHNEDCKELLRLMGVPYINAPCEAEAQCAELAKKGKVYATATEDMDALTFRTPKLLRRFTFSQGKDKQSILEVDFEAVLRGLKLTYDEFVDLCILCGCDYCSTIKGIGPKTALRLIRTHHSIENIVVQLKREKKHQIPADWLLIKVAKIKVDDCTNTDTAASAASTVVVDGEGEQVDDRLAQPVAATVGNHSQAGGEPAIALTETAVSESDANIGGSAVEGEVSKGTEGSLKASEPESSSVVVEGSSNEGMEDEDDIPMAVLDDDDDAANVDEEDDAEFAALFGISSSTTEAEEGGMEEEVALVGDESELFEIVPPLYQQARVLFHSHDVIDGDTIDLKWASPDEEGLISFLVGRMGFNVERVKNGIKKLQEAQKMKSQKRMDSFFTALPSSSNATAGVKRKVEDSKGKGAAGKKGALPAKKGGGGRGAPRR